jgi:hypothetical protein
MNEELEYKSPAQIHNERDDLLQQFELNLVGYEQWNPNALNSYVTHRDHRDLMRMFLEILKRG